MSAKWADVHGILPKRFSLPALSALAATSVTASWRRFPSKSTRATWIRRSPTKATFRTLSAHHETSGKWKPRPFSCCAVNRLACREPSTAVVTSNHGARARHSLSSRPNASSTPPTRSFAQAIPESEAPKNGGWPTSSWPAAVPLSTTASWHPSLCFYTAVGSHICRPAKKSWHLPCVRPRRNAVLTFVDP